MRIRLPSLIVLSLTLMFILTGCGIETTTAPVAPTATQTTPTAPPGAATLSEIVNLVEAARPSENEFARVDNGFVLNNGGQVRTANESRVRLDLTSSTIIRLGQNSLFKMEELTPGGEGPLVRVKLEFGRLWVSLAGGSVEVETPVGSASVRGSFGVIEYDPSLDVLTLSCLEGTCNAENDTVKEQLGNLEQVRLTRGGQDVTRTQLTLDEVKAFTDVNPDQGPSLLSTLLAAPPPSATPEPTTEVKSRITGTVYADLNADLDAADSGEGPLSGVNVTLSGCTAVSVTLVTGDDGRFVFENLPVAACQLQFEKGGWAYGGAFSGDIAFLIPVQVFASADASADLTVFMQPTETPTVAPTIFVPLPTATTAPPPTATATVTPTPQAQITFNADKTFLVVEECTTLRWTVLNVQAALLDGAGVTGEGAKEVCPVETTTYKLTVQTFSGIEERTLTLVITLPSPTATETPPADTVGPTLTNSSATEPSYYGCSFQSMTFFTVNVTDPSGLQSVKLWYRYENTNQTQVGGWGSVTMTDQGNSNYSATIDNDDSATGAYNVLRGANGYIRWYVLATDKPGNATNSGEALTRILACVA